MITLITGLPGAGKTLYTIYLVEKLAHDENRQVYYNGITDLALPWNPLEKVDDWLACPVGSIIVIDECQRSFRPRGVGSNVPESVEAMETHRHKGLDIYLITQHPMLLDSNIRRLVGLHYHLMRAFGSNAANIHEWGEVREGCDKSRTGSITTFWKYPKEVFKYYKSAEMHTHRFRPPGRVILLVFLPFLLGGAVWVAVSWFKGSGVAGAAAAAEKKPGVVQAQGGPGGGQAKKLLDGPEFQKAHLPRVPGFTHTAPIYDEVIKPVDAPYPVGCVADKGCRCFDQQNSIMAMDESVCRSLARTGFFKSWEKINRGNQR